MDKVKTKETIKRSVVARNREEMNWQSKEDF